MPVWDSPRPQEGYEQNLKGRPTATNKQQTSTKTATPSVDSNNHKAEDSELDYKFRQWNMRLQKPRKPTPTLKNSSAETCTSEAPS